ncbi:MAG: TIGR00266 family protein [Planctomycetota bacterium]
MNVDIRHGPAFATLFAELSAGDSIVAEADAMASMDASVQMRTRFNGGPVRALVKRVFGGESLFVNEFSGPGQVVLTQATPGDVARIELDGDTLHLEPGSFIACGPEVSLGLRWAGFASFIGGEGLFKLEVSGHGPVFFGGYGGIYQQEVQGELVVDSGHLIAYEPTLSLSVGMASRGIFSSFFSGEGLVTRVRGQGTAYLQSRSVGGLVHWTNGHLF